MLQKVCVYKTYFSCNVVWIHILKVWQCICSSLYISKKQVPAYHNQFFLEDGGSKLLSKLPMNITQCSRRLEFSKFKSDFLMGVENNHNPFSPFHRIFCGFVWGRWSPTARSDSLGLIGTLLALKTAAKRDTPTSHYIRALTSLRQTTRHSLEGHNWTFRWGHDIISKRRDLITHRRGFVFQ
jgi:hypothetical protein